MRTTSRGETLHCKSDLELPGSVHGVKCLPRDPQECGCFGRRWGLSQGAGRSPQSGALVLPKVSERDGQAPHPRPGLGHPGSRGWRGSSGRQSGLEGDHGGVEGRRAVGKMSRKEVKEFPSETDFLSHVAVER